MLPDFPLSLPDPDNDRVARIMREVFFRVAETMPEALVVPLAPLFSQVQSAPVASIVRWQWSAHLVGGFTLTLLVLLSASSAGLAHPIVCRQSPCGDERPEMMMSSLHAAAPAPSQLQSVEERARERPSRVASSQSASSALLFSSGTTSSRGHFHRFHDAPKHTPLPVLRADNRMGIYLSAANVERGAFFDQTFSALTTVHGSALVFDVKGGMVFFDADAPLAKEWGLVKPFYDLPTVLQKAKNAGVYTIARFVAVKDAVLTDRHPELGVHHPKTGKLMRNGWIDPANPTALEYNRQILCALAASGVDEINLDYIRFSTAYVGQFRVFSGKEKADRVEQFVRMARDAIDACGPRTKLGLSTYAILGWDYPTNLETLGQDVVRFAPLVDVISPMAYPATFQSPEYYDPKNDGNSRDYSLVYRTLTGYQKLLGADAAKLRPWIQGYGVTPQDVRNEIQAVYDAGLCGFTVWSAGNNYASTYEALRNPPKRPERCE
ncbi:hypothetical protein HY285_05025 [Candidatus Peregrinibacteria bacterium]|nr:hypothetical protein [Candidatus Peregrinibacteria bacterium]MBI3816874.1 hypothetical protein [Candidatus Peregrinibacteria bacterium]